MPRRSATVLLLLLVVLPLMAGGFGVQSRITTSAFDRLEADQVEQDAQRVRIGLDS
jgi:sensor domain CHASE-containing protein